MTLLDGPATDTRWSRQLALPGFGAAELARLRSATVVVVGAGGVGSGVLPALVAAGVGRVIVVDDDVVESSNLSRQTLHTATDVGAPKVESAAAALRPLATGDVVAVRERVEAASAARLIAGADLVIDATDSPATRYALDDATAAAGRPLVWGSATGVLGQVGVSWADRGPRWRDLFPVRPDDDGIETCATGGVFPPLCATVGALVATEALKVLTGFGEPLIGRLLVVDAFAATVREVVYARADGREPSKESESESGEVTAPELHELLADDADVQLVDVREPWEAQIAALPGSVLIPLRELPARIEELDRARPVITYCHAGVRSADAAEFLVDQGFRARSLTGGIDAWSRSVDPDLPRY